MAIHTEEPTTAISNDGAGAFRVVLMVTVGLIVAWDVISLTAAGVFVRRFLLAPGARAESMAVFGSGVLETVLILLPLGALAVIAFRGIGQFPWLGWFLALYISLLGLGTVIRSLPLRGPLDLDFFFGVLLLILALVLLLVRPRPAPSTEPSV